jgi:hypothetical protein
MSMGPMDNPSDAHDRRRQSTFRRMDHERRWAIRIDYEQTQDHYEI